MDEGRSGEALLIEREATHGPYATTATIAQGLKKFLHHYQENWTDAQRESMDNICTKIARLHSGRSDLDEHWRDIEGYARLARREGVKLESPSGE